MPDRCAGLRPHYPVLIAGGGINGAATFRDLSLQGVDCLLVDAGDFCAGASAAPSRLIHGGIKYLESGQFKLVRQSTLERNLLLRNAPHYVEPIETVLPIRSLLGGILPTASRFLGGGAKLTDRGALVVKIGLAMFDWFGRRHRSLPRHRMMFRRGLRRDFPEMASDIRAVAIYYDAKVSFAERLGLELVLDALEANQSSLALNHVAVEAAESGAVVIADRTSGGRHRVTADIIVNAAGASIDAVNRRLGLHTRHIGGQRGSHLVVANRRLREALGSKMVYFGASDGRVALLYPFMGNVLVGSTDIPVDDPDNAVCDQDECRYMIDVVAEIFPTIPITADQVVYTYSGVRPLPRGSLTDPGAVSRDHSIVEDRLAGGGPPVFSLIGGKWTTFRGFAEEAADLVLRRLGRVRVRRTDLLAIGGGRDFPREAVGMRALEARIVQLGLNDARARQLVARYGTRALAVARWCATRDDAPLHRIADHGRAEIGFIAAHEAVAHLADIVFRRTGIALSGRLDRDVVEEVAGIAAGELGWDPARARLEVEDVIAIATGRHGVAAARFDKQEIFVTGGHR